MDVQINLDIMLQAVKNHYEEVYMVDYLNDTVVFLKSSQIISENWLKGIPMPYKETMDCICNMIAYEEERTFAKTLFKKMRDKDRNSEIYREIFPINTTSTNLTVINTNLVQLIYLDETHRLVCSNRTSKFSRSNAYGNNSDENNIKYCMINLISKSAIFAQTYRIPSGNTVHTSFEVQPRIDLNICDIDNLSNFIFIYKKSDSIWNKERFMRLIQPQNLAKYPLFDRIPLAGEWDGYEIVLSATQSSDTEGSLFAMMIRINDTMAVARRNERSVSREAIDLICGKLDGMAFPENSIYQLVLVSMDDFRKYNIEEYDRITVNIFKVLYQTYESCYYINIDDNNGCFLFWEAANEGAFTTILSNIRKQLYNKVIADTSFTVSIGWSSFRYFSDMDVIFAYNEANRALRAAEKIGGNRILRYESEMDDDLWIVQMNKYAHQSDVEIRTFGHFDVFVDSKPVIFRSAKAKELLALMVDRRGGFVTTKEAVEAMWPEDEFNAKSQARYRKVVARLNAALEDYGIERIVKNYRGKRRLDITMINCDYYKFQEDPVSYRGRYSGDYLTGYKWADNTRNALDSIKVRRK